MPRGSEPWRGSKDFSMTSSKVRTTQTHSSHCCVCCPSAVCNGKRESTRPSQRILGWARGRSASVLSQRTCSNCTCSRTLDLTMFSSSAGAPRMASSSKTSSGRRSRRDLCTRWRAKSRCKTFAWVGCVRPLVCARIATSCFCWKAYATWSRRSSSI